MRDLLYLITGDREIIFYQNQEYLSFNRLISANNNNNGKTKQNQSHITKRKINFKRNRALFAHVKNYSSRLFSAYTIQLFTFIKKS